MKISEKIKSGKIGLERIKKVPELFGKGFGKFKKMKKPLKMAVILALVLVIAVTSFGLTKLFGGKKAVDGNLTTSVVMQGNVIYTITGSGTVEPIEQREIVPLVNGKILEAPFEEGDSVKTDDILYKFEMTSAENAIETAQNNVQKAQTSLENKASNIEKVKANIAKLTIRATASGKISGLSLNVGEEVSGKICSVTNYKEQTATIPFSASQINNIKVGDSATIFIEKYMMNMSGKVVRKYSAAEILSSGAVTYNVEIMIKDDFTVEENVNATATIHAAGGDVESASYGSIEYTSPVSVNAEQKGKVSSVYVKNGDWVDKGDIIAVLANDDLTDELKTAQQSYKDAEMSLSEAESNLEDKQEEAENHIVTSPIDGTVLTKSYTAGDTVSGQNATTMMVVADMSKMKFTISVDELDIAKIELGQSVSVTADALENQMLQGTITSVSKSGTASNGVTTYPVEVTIDQPGNLMSGMNVSAQIIVERADNCLYLPLSAVEYYGGKYYVTIVGEVENMPEMPQAQNRASRDEDAGATATQDGKMPEGERPEGGTPQGERPEGGTPQGERPEGARPSGEMPQRDESSENRNADEQNTKSESSKSGKREENEMKIKMHNKEERVEVEVGISNDEYYEIKSGVSLGQVVKNTTQATSSESSVMPGGMPGGMGGGMSGVMGGGMPGGMGGGMPGGMGGRR